MCRLMIFKKTQFQVVQVEELSCTINPINIINKCKFLSQQMDGEQLPKATMNSFIKSRTTLPFSADYLTKVLYIAKEFVARVADKSNVMCESYQKKTINSDHLEAALKQFGLTHHLQELKNIEENMKEQNQLKRQASQRMEEMLAKDKQQERERRRMSETEKKQVTDRQKFDQIQRHAEKKEEEFDYENLVQDEVQMVKKIS